MAIELAKNVKPKLGQRKSIRLDPNAPWPFKVQGSIPSGIRVINVDDPREMAAEQKLQSETSRPPHLPSSPLYAELNNPTRNPSTGELT